ncbi:unnamed protein product [Paramecium pentaurelia]|uniref:START domain-containing protein n=1 Tax=Paramecium pentaurelia TaxID=43138 RepID=A0A8S1SSW1_9CILI|nr:unnamed protein product [Paramecium pentaurelia]
MLRICQCIRQLFIRCLNIFKYTRVENVEKSYQMESVSRDIESNMNAELRAHEDSFIQNPENKIEEFENKANFQDCEQLIDEETIRQFIDDIPHISFSQSELIKEIGERAVVVFTQVIDKMDGFELLEKDEDFNFWIKYVETSEKFQIGIMKYTYTLNTSIDSYIEFMKDLQLQKQMDNSIDAFEKHYEDINFQINYLRYKKIMFMDPRDFLYIKYTDRKGDDCIEISKSINVDHFQPQELPPKQCTRALLLLSGNQIKQIEDNKIMITTYSECNMKLKLKPVMTKQASKNEIKKMVKRYRDHFNQ